MERSGRGRQAEARHNDEVVLDAARLVFAVHGRDAPVSAVAAAAGVGMGTLYRRYPSKEALLQHLCLASMAQQVAAAQTALGRRGEPWEAVEEFIRSCVSLRAGVFTAVAGTIAVTDEMQASARQAHNLLERLVMRARRAGVLRPDVASADIFQLIELFSRRRPDHEAAHLRLLAVALDGLRVGARVDRTSGPGRLPGIPPTWAALRRSWLSKSPPPT